MPTPKAGYFLKDGTKVPGTTTIIGRFKEAGGLIHWSWECGKKGLDYREVRDQAADAGTLAHELVERWINKQPLDITGPDEVVKKARNAFSAFLEWADQTRLQVTHTEVRLISEKYQYGGTLDAMLVNGKFALGDWKTSNRIYGDYLIQLAAYGNLWAENFPDQPITGGYHLMRFAKEHGDFSHHYFSELNEAFEAFVLMRRLYDLDKQLKKRAA